MSWGSVLPPALATLETWLVRFFLFGAVITIGPWLALVLYDLLLYIARTFVHEVPIYGGRSRGRPRPRGPSLSARPDGRPRRFSIAAAATGSEGLPIPASEPDDTIGEGLRAREAVRGGEGMEDSMFD